MRKKHNKKPKTILETNCINCNRIVSGQIHCSIVCMVEARAKSRNLLIEAGLYKRPPALKEYLAETVGYRCTICGNDGVHLGKALVLQLDHVDGNPDNNNLTNLRLLCPNCHTQTETYSGGSKNKHKTDDRNVKFRNWYNTTKQREVTNVQPMFR